MFNIYDQRKKKQAISISLPDYKDQGAPVCEIKIKIDWDVLEETAFFVSEMFELAKKRRKARLEHEKAKKEENCESKKHSKDLFKAIIRCEKITRKTSMLFEEVYVQVAYSCDVVPETLASAFKYGKSKIIKRYRRMRNKTIFSLVTGGAKQKEVAERFGVTTSAVSQVMRKKNIEKNILHVFECGNTNLEDLGYKFGKSQYYIHTILSKALPADQLKNVKIQYR